MPGQDQQTGGIPVQPVNDPVSKSLPLFMEIPGDGFGQGMVIVARGGVDRHACIPVSYTHLDVYKRQECGGIRFLRLEDQSVRGDKRASGHSGGRRECLQGTNCYQNICFFIFKSNIT